MSRYVVSSVTGYTINPDAERESSAKTTEWYVLDTANCYAIVRAYSRPFADHDAEDRARAACLRLNADERRWERTGR